MDAGRDGWVDVSVVIRTGMVHWPGDPSVSIERVEDIDKGSTATVSRISMGAHTGTHIDAPLHFIRGGAGIEAMPLNAVAGPARVIGIKDAQSVKVEELERHDIRAGERILFKTRNSSLWRKGGFQEDFVYLSTDAAEYLVARRVMTVGIDYLSVGGFHKNGTEVHRILLGGGVWIIEGLDLSAVDEGSYELVCLPLMIEGAEAAPARAMLRRVETP